MELEIDAPVVLDTLRNLYKGALRGSRVLDDIVRVHRITHEEAVEVLHFLLKNQLILNIEKNRINGDAVYKLTRRGEVVIEERLSCLYHPNPKAGGVGGLI
ncbi:MAG: hypothetical protein QXH42_02110 [Thermoplasmata archaeon]